MLSDVVGCAPANREQLTREILKADPGFAVVLDKHRELTNRIKTYERELALKRSTVERQIVHLRKELATAASTVRTRTQEARTRMEPERQRWQLALAMASEELRAKQLQRASLGRSIANLRTAAKTAGEVWSPSERAQHEAQMEQLRGDAKRLEAEITTLREHGRLLKIKLLLIRL